MRCIYQLEGSGWFDDVGRGEQWEGLVLVLSFELRGHLNCHFELAALTELNSCPVMLL